MARNRVFRRRYIIEVKGITTNNFMIRFLDSVIGGLVKSVGEKFTQVKVHMMSADDLASVDELSRVYKCPNCGSIKFLEDSDCLFCAAEEEAKKELK